MVMVTAIIHIAIFMKAQYTTCFCRSTRFRWQQHPLDDIEAITDWGIKDVYIGSQCDRMCSGHGNCHYPACNCDEGYTGSECYAWTADNPVSR